MMVLFYLWFFQHICHSNILQYKCKTQEHNINPDALRMAKTQWSFGHSERNKVKLKVVNQDSFLFQTSTFTTQVLF